MAKKSVTGSKSGTSTAVLDQPTGAIEHPKPLAREFKSIPLAAVVEARGPNTRPSIPKESILQLAESLKAQGLLQPIVVGAQDSATGFYPILAGRRRLAAATHLGWERINACVLDGGAARALEILVTENAQREDPDPLLEADVIARMLERPNWGHAEVAAALGRPTTWVARRAKLIDLSEEARTLIEELRMKRPSSWPTTWLEEVAIAPKEAQLEIVDFEPYDIGDLRSIVRRAMRSLGSAPWPLEATDITKAGACITCPKHSAAAPSLFPEDPSLHQVKGALCMDAECFAAKRAAWTKHRAVELKEEVGGDVLLVHGLEPYKSEFVANDEFGKGTKVHFAQDFSPAKKTDKDAKPALIVDGPKAGNLVYVKKFKKGQGNLSKATGGSTRAAGDKPVKSLAERRKDLELRRKRHAFEEFCAEVEELAKGWASFKVLDESLNDAGVLRLAASFLARGDNPRAIAHQAAEEIRTRLLKHVVHELRLHLFRKSMGAGENVTNALHDVETFIEIVRWTGDQGLEARLAKATAAVPEPKSWSTEKSAPKPKAKLRAKRAPSPKVKKGAKRKGGK